MMTFIGKKVFKDNHLGSIFKKLFCTSESQFKSSEDF